jgi:hypothetical protein
MCASATASAPFIEASQAMAMAISPMPSKTHSHKTTPPIKMQGN